MYSGEFNEEGFQLIAGETDDVTEKDYLMNGNKICGSEFQIYFITYRAEWTRSI